MKLSDLKPLHDAGMSLIYLHEKEKRPIGNEWTKKENLSWKELKNAFNSRNNVGVRLGAPSLIGDRYLCCIDVDIIDPAYRKEALRKLREVCGEQFGSYPEVRSGSGNGSRHLYGVSAEPFKMLEIEKHKDKWSICAYSTGRQMVLPPSVHPSGGSYVWKVPFDAASVPSFRPGRFLNKSSRPQSTNGAQSRGAFKAEEVNLYDSRLGIQVIKKIETGQGVEDRSAELLGISMAMCRAGFTDNQILSVLTDESHWISEAAYEHTQSRDRSRAVHWLDKYTLQKARYETDINRRFENKPLLKPLSKKEAQAVASDLVEESNQSLPDRDGNGKPKNTLRNVIHVLSHQMGGPDGVVGFDDFANRAVFLRDTPYGGVKGREVSDRDDLALKHYLACHYRFEPSKEICYEAHALIARLNAYHPVRTFLSGLEWDGVARLDGWLKEAFGASGPKDYIGAVSRKILVAAVKRVFEPGCKFDYVLVLEGFQGKGKSAALEALTQKNWFTDSLPNIQDKDAISQMEGKWLIEMAELSNIKKSDIDSMKAFITRQVDRCRPPYGRRTEDYPRQCVFIGTTNNSEYLIDETGNRRFWPVQISKIDREWVKENREQLWAEAMVRYELGEEVYFDNEEIEALANKEQEKRYQVDEWESEIRKVVSRLQPNEKITSTEIWRAIHINDGGGHPSIGDTMRIGKVMIRLRFNRKVLRIDGISTKCWVATTATAL